MSVLFSASLSEDTETIIFFTPTNDISRVYNVYETYLGVYPTNSYWLEWGGYYDNPIINQIELYVGGQYLIRVNSLTDCADTPFSFYDEESAGTVYINTPKHTWLYDDVFINFRKSVTYLSGPKDSNNPSDDVFGNEHWPTRLEVPKFSVKLSDVINGLTKYSTFDFILHNDDGYFDDIEATNFFNSPSYVRKTWKENPSINDFIQIRYGVVETIKIDDKIMTVSCADLFRTLEEPVCKAVEDVFITAEKNKDDNLPVVYGTTTVRLIEIGDSQYVAGENIIKVDKVYDTDGRSVEFSFSNGVITSTAENISSATVTGNINNNIGQVIIDTIISKTQITYISTFFDLDETNDYIATAPAINIAFTGGDVKSAVKNALSSNMVFLIQKNDGRFTLRKWGKTYNTFTMKNWEITKFPVKDYTDTQKNYFSSCLIYYNYVSSTSRYNNVLLYDENEAHAEEVYNKLVRKEFRTYLTNNTDAYNLAAKLSDRFSTLRETVQVSIGHDTSEINLLDTVELELDVNGRVFSKYHTWIVKEIDPAQDVLTLEPVISF